MVKGAYCAGLMLVFALVAPGADAAAQARGEVGKSDPKRARALAEANRAKGEARAAEAEIAALDSRKREAVRRAAEAEAADRAVRRRIGELEIEAAQSRAGYERDREIVERLAIAASLANRARVFDRRAAEMEAFVRAAGPAAAGRIRDHAQTLADNRRVREELALARTFLAEARSAIVEERQGIDALLARQRAIRQTQLATALDAEQRARRLARRSRTLREFAQRVHPQGAASTVPGTLGPLRPPAPGVLVRGFGRPTPAGRSATGLTYRTQPGAAVVAPASGVVRYAGLFRSYGQILILALDNDYVIVLAGMESLGARTGEVVAAGQHVGRMAAKPAPELYVEVRHNGRPIDPTRRLAS
jgi:septal ring factor EnvC (AmiA/AmiB activator)